MNRSWSWIGPVLNSLWKWLKSKVLGIHRTSFENWTEDAICNKNQTTLVNTTIVHPQKKSKNQYCVILWFFKESPVSDISKKIESKNQQFQVFQRTVGFHERLTGCYTVFFLLLKCSPRDDNRQRTGAAAQHW
jgi:hypothetical protein